VDAHRGVRATDGSQFVELDFAGARDGFFQDVDAATGQAYELSFDLRGRAGAPVSSQGVEVVWNDRVVATATPGADWGTFTTTVTGAAGTDRLTIREVAAQGGDGLGALVDDFVLVPAGAPAGGTGPDTVSVRVSGDAWEGDPAFGLTVNGRTVASSTTVTADHAAGEWQTFTFAGDWDLDGSDQVGVRFLEDRYAGPAATATCTSTRSGSTVRPTGRTRRSSRPRRRPGTSEGQGRRRSGARPRATRPVARGPDRAGPRIVAQGSAAAGSSPGQRTRQPRRAASVAVRRMNGAPRAPGVSAGDPNEGLRDDPSHTMA
jgi:hypothetical protein